MNPAIIIYGFLLFAASLIVHIVIWRLRVPWLSSIMLIFLMLGLPTVSMVAVIFGIGGMSGWAGLGAVEWMQVLLLHLSLASAYIVGYPAVRAVSPSLDILVMISSSPGGSIKRGNLLRRYSEARVVTARVDDLLEYRLLILQDGKFTVSPLARWIVRIFSLYRRLLGLPAGGG